MKCPLFVVSVGAIRCLSAGEQIQSEPRAVQVKYLKFTGALRAPKWCQLDTWWHSGDLRVTSNGFLRILLVPKLDPSWPQATTGSLCQYTGVIRISNRKARSPKHKQKHNRTRTDSDDGAPDERAISRNRISTRKETSRHRKFPSPTAAEAITDIATLEQKHQKRKYAEDPRPSQRAMKPPTYTTPQKKGKPWQPRTR